MRGATATGGLGQAAALAAGLVLLNASVTFASVWPTLGIRPAMEISVEVAALVLLLATARQWRQAPLPPLALGALALLWAALVVAHYIQVTTRALYGRSVSLYWDLALVPDVGAMFTAVANPALVAMVIAAAVIVPLTLYLPLRWAIGVVDRAVASAAARRTLLALSAAVALGGIALRATGGDRLIAAPVSTAVAQEVAQFARDALGNPTPLPPPPSIDSDLSLVRGADVRLVFVESYGVVSWERKEFQESLAPLRAGLADAIADTGRAVVSSRVESTTFGGESWLAHISLLSGTEVRDQGTNRRLMAERRDTLVSAFARSGYRTLGIFPGLHAPWPEGRFYGFDRIVTRPDLRYEGPPFGWWDVTDQFVLARLEELAADAQAASPSFVFLPTISTHTPFTPVPPYQSDWSRLLTPAPYDEPELLRAYEAVPDWTNLSPAYARSLAYLHATLAGYLRQQAGRDLVLVVLGDHQPPALVSGEGASWDVPVHVIASRPAVLDRLRERGFRDGLVPPATALARMDALMPMLLDAFGNPE